MQLNERDSLMLRLVTVENFSVFLDSLCLTDRQKKIAKMKYLQGMVNEDIAAEMFLARRTITKELSIIRQMIGRAELKHQKVK